MTLDEAREQNPELAFLLSAMDPGGAITLEIITPDGDVFRFDGPTEGAVLALAFPVEIAPAASEMTTDIFD